MSSEVEQHTSQRLLVRRLVLVAVLMFGFGFLLAPLYDVFCRVTGLNGKITNIGAPSQIVAVDAGRQVRVQFLAINNEGMPWRFQPEQAQLLLHPGEQQLTHYIAVNPTPREMVARAVPSVAPAEAAQYLHKINCFCFESQTLAAAASQRMPLVLMIDPQLPAHIDTVTLSYTLFDISGQRVAQRDAASVIPAAVRRLAL